MIPFKSSIETADSWQQTLYFLLSLLKWSEQLVYSRTGIVEDKCLARDLDKLTVYLVLFRHTA